MSESQSGYLSPDEITNVSFETKRRGGIDPDAVKRHLSSVAATVHGITAERESLQAQVDALRDELNAVPEASPAPEALDEAELTERLGQDAARVLSEARAAAADRLAEADEEAAAILAAAEEVHAERSAAADLEAQRIRASAESVVEERRVEAERAAAEIVAAAEADATQARTAGSTDRETADAEAARIIREAELTRRQILEDLARRRSSARRQIEQLRAGRERLLASHETVRRALDEISDELTISMSEARAAAETAGHSVSETTIEELEAEIETARLTGLLDTGPLPVVERRPSAQRPSKPTAVAPVSKSTPSSEIGVAPAADASEVEAEGDSTNNAADVKSTDEPSATAENGSNEGNDTSGSPGNDTDTDEVAAADGTSGEAETTELASGAEAPVSTDDDTTDAGADLAPVVQLDRARSEVDTATHPAKGRDAGNGRSAPKPPQKQEAPTPAKVTKLESVKPAQPDPQPDPEPEDVPAPEAEKVALDAPAAEAPAETVAEEEDDDSVGDLFASLRSETPKPAPKKSAPTKKTVTAKKSTAKKAPAAKSDSAPVADVDSSEMARRLKRVLADEQSRAMSKVKSSDELPALADLLGSEDEHVETYWVEVLGQLDDVSDGTDEVRAPVGALVNDIRRRVGSALEGADGDGESAVNALRSVYRELKTQKITPCADAVCRTAGVGVSS